MSDGSVFLTFIELRDKGQALECVSGLICYLPLFFRRHVEESLLLCVLQVAAAHGERPCCPAAL